VFIHASPEKSEKAEKAKDQNNRETAGDSDRGKHKPSGDFFIRHRTWTFLLVPNIVAVCVSSCALEHAEERLLRQLDIADHLHAFLALLLFFEQLLLARDIAACE
jgi:hypothetical protein